MWNLECELVSWGVHKTGLAPPIALRQTQGACGRGTAPRAIATARDAWRSTQLALFAPAAFLRPGGLGATPMGAGWTGL